MYAGHVLVLFIYKPFPSRYQHLDTEILHICCLSELCCKVPSVSFSKDKHAIQVKPAGQFPGSLNVTSGRQNLVLVNALAVCWARHHETLKLRSSKLSNSGTSCSAFVLIPSSHPVLSLCQPESVYSLEPKIPPRWEDSSSTQPSDEYQGHILPVRL